LEAAVPTPVEDERLALVPVAELDHAPDDDQVVTGVVFCDRFAVDERERLLDDRRAGAARRVRDACEAVGALLREQPADLLAVLVEEVGGPLAGRLDARPRGRRLRG